MFIALFMSFALANFSGYWSGEGVMTSPTGSFPCEIEFRIAQSEEVIDVQLQKVWFNDLAINWSPYGANIINGELFNHQTGIYGGTIEPGKIRVDYLMSADSAPYIINADKITEDSADFHMILYGSDGPRNFKAILYKQ